MRHITVAFNDPALFCLLQTVLGDLGDVVIGSPLNPNTIDTLHTIQPDLVLIEVGIGRANVGWKVLDDLRADPRLQRIPAVVYSVDSYDLEQHAVLLSGFGYPTLVLPSTIEDIRAIISAACHSPFQQALRSQRLENGYAEAASR